MQINAMSFDDLDNPYSTFPRYCTPNNINANATFDSPAYQPCYKAPEKPIPELQQSVIITSPIISITHLDILDDKVITAFLSDAIELAFIFFFLSMTHSLPLLS